MIYLDYNATSPLCEPAMAAIQPFLERHYGNPSSVHAAGREARAGVDDARDRLAGLLGAKPHELVFTSSGTESNNLAVLGLARAHTERGRHLICATTEHHAVLQAFEHLGTGEGFEVTFLRVNELGRVDPDDFQRALREDTTVVSIMTANNETGVIQPMEELADLCRGRGALLHSDMVQSFGKLETHLGESGLAAASFAAHKFHGPKGAGLLYLRAGLPIEAIQFGGAHENQRRPGTENVPAIVGMAAAAEWTLRDRAREQGRQGELRDRLWNRIHQSLPSATQNADTAHRLSNTLNVSFTGLSSETILMALDLEGVCASSGSACMVGSVVASHVLLAMGLPASLASSAVRFSLGHETTGEEIERAGEIVARVMNRVGSARSNAADLTFPPGPTLVVLGRDFELEKKAREMLQALDASELARSVRVEWNARLFSAAGRADFRRKLISLNPRLREHDVAEVERTLRHELAHLLAQFHAGRRRVAPHGAEWRKACRDLGIGGESRTHALPFPIQRRSRRLLYECPRCGKEFPRVRRIKRAVACLDCCRKFNRGEFDGTAQLRLVQRE